MTSRREEALKLAEELLADIELQKLEPMAIARKASRLARLTDDTLAMNWLEREVTGYPPNGSGPLTADFLVSAQLANRIYTNGDKTYTHRDGLGALTATIEAASIQLAAATDPSHHISSSNPHQHVHTPPGNQLERAGIRNSVVVARGVLDKVLGSIHLFVARKYQELRFGAAVESAFDEVRGAVDSRIAELVPDALPLLTTALENASTDNPVQWTNAAKACRDLIKATADALQPPSSPISGREMTDANYINRLAYWIEQHSQSETKGVMVKSDLEHFGKRIDAVTNGGHKGAHGKVTRADASRYIVGTYLLLGDVLALVKPTA